jgi:hypothetical protein
MRFSLRCFKCDFSNCGYPYEIYNYTGAGDTLVYDGEDKTPDIWWRKGAMLGYSDPKEGKFLILYRGIFYEELQTYITDLDVAMSAALGLSEG